MKELTKIAKLNETQVAFCEKLGLQMRDCTVTLAAARVHDAIDADFFGLTDLGRPTEKQIELAAKFNHDISGLTKREGNAVIDDLMSQLNYEAIDSESLAPGVVVTNVHDSIPQTYVISSIAPDGTVYFRGGNGRKAWARSLRRAKTSDAAGP